VRECRVDLIFGVSYSLNKGFVNSLPFPSPLTTAGRLDGRGLG